VSEHGNEGVADLALTLENMKEDYHSQVGLLGKDKENGLRENMQSLVDDLEPFF
jgi:hypothetical protein